MAAQLLALVTVNGRSLKLSECFTACAGAGTQSGFTPVELLTRLG